MTPTDGVSKIWVISSSFGGFYNRLFGFIRNDIKNILHQNVKQLFASDLIAQNRNITF